jgi:recombination protein RecA
MFDYHMRQSGAHAEEERSLTMARTASKAKIPTDASKEEALKITKEQIRKKYGDGSIMRLGDEDSALDVEVIPTGALALDAALGIGGVPRGRIVEIYGPESSGKTTLSLQIVAEAQALGGVAAFIDAEHALDPVYAAKIGVDIDELLISQPDTGEQALEICDMLVRSNAVSCIVIDSVAALVPRAEIEGEIGDASVGLQARLMSQALRKLAGSLSKSNTCCIFINQLREKIGVMFGSPETTTGGRALKFFSSVRLDIRRIETIKVDGGAVGNRVRVKVVKNKCSAPFRQAEFDIMYGTGISREGNILDMAVDEKIVTKSGSWYTYGDERLGQGREAAKNALVESPDLRREIENKVRAVIGLPVEYDDDDAFTLADVPTTGFSGSENLPDSVVTENSAAE